MATHMPVTENTLIAIKISVHGNTKKLKVPLKDLGADKLIPKVWLMLMLMLTAVRRHATLISDHSN